MSFSLVIRLQLGCLIASLLGLLLSGCAKNESIHTYTIEKETPDRLLGAIILRDDAAWFFKLVGPKSEIDAVTDEFKDFVKTVKFDPGKEAPRWTVPNGWQQAPPARQSGRIATIKVPLESGEGDLSVTVLGRSSRNENEYLLANINRWREQMSQFTIGDVDLESLDTFDANGLKVWFVTVAGKQKSGGMAAPFAGGRG